MRKSLLFLLFIYSFVGQAQNVDTSRMEKRVFQLGEVLVLDKSMDSLLTISSREMEKFNRTDISDALNLLPGITIEGGSQK